MNIYSFIQEEIEILKECDMCEQICTHPQTICLARSEIIEDDKVLSLAELFKVLGDPTRLRVLDILSKHEMCVCDIAETLRMGQSAISHTLRVLRSSKLVKYRKDGKQAWYSLDDDHVSILLQQALEHISHK